MELSKAGTIMNSKSEWNNSKIPRIVIESGEKLTPDVKSSMGSKTNDKQREIEKRRCNVKRYVATKRDQVERESQQPTKRFRESEEGGKRGWRGM